AVCRALLMNPRLVVCDEPTGNLDPSRSGQIVELLLSEADRIGATALLVTHDHSVLGSFSRVIDFEQVGSLEGDRA
ncbi:MAG: ABC transporter ATP-binding protein, partial [Planctomycetota bacterium]